MWTGRDKRHWIWAVDSSAAELQYIFQLKGSVQLCNVCYDCYGPCPHVLTDDGCMIGDSSLLSSHRLCCCSAVTSWSIGQPSGPEIISHLSYCIWHNTAEVKTYRIRNTCAMCHLPILLYISTFCAEVWWIAIPPISVYSTLFLMILFCKHPPSEHTANKSWPIPMEYISFYEVNFETFAKEEIKWKKVKTFSC